MPETSPALLQLSGIHKSFGATRALAGVELAVSAGEVHALIGENGAGKSTLMNILGGAFPPDRGSMRFGGADYRPRGPREARAVGIAHIHQELSLCPHLSVAENVALGMEPARAGVVDRAAMERQAASLLAEFGCEHISPRIAAGRLPVADQQVVEICRAMAMKAKLVLMDEPTSSLTRGSIERLFAVIQRLAAQGVAILYISHFLEELRQIAGSYTVLRDGKSVQSGRLDEVKDQQLIAAMVGREVDEMFLAHERPASPAAGDVVLSARNISSPPRLKSASFELRRGEVMGIGGLIGSGRTELVRALFGLERATGELTVAGKTISARGLSSAAQIRNGLGYLSEDRKGEGVCLQLSIADNSTITRMAAISRGGWISTARQDEAAQAIIQRLSVRTPGPRLQVIKLSGGNQQKVALGRLLHQDPDVLLLDEPTRGIDVGSKADIYREIRRLADAGKTILMVSSYLPELMGVCDRIAVMSRGVLSDARPAAQWTQESIMQAAIAGSAQEVS